MKGIKAKKAIKLWKDFVTRNHYKSRDLEFSVLELGCFYDKEKWYVAILPKPYVLDGPIVSDRFKNKNLAIIDLILLCFSYMEDWCNEVLNHPEEYDEEQNDQARFFKETELERIKLAFYLKEYESRKRFYETEIKDILNLD